MSSAPNPYQTPTTAAWTSVDERAQFLTRTYLHVFGGVVAFTLLEVFFFTSGLSDQLFNTLLAGGAVGWLVVLGGMFLVSIVANKMAYSQTSQATQYGGLGLYIVAEAIIFCPLLTVALQMEQTRGVEILGPSAILSLVLFGGLTAIVFVTRKDFSFLRGVLLFGTLAAFAIIIFAAFTGMNLGIFFTGAMIALMCGYILYETSEILNRFPTNMHVAASLALLASLLTLFWYAIRLMMILASDD